MFGGIRARFAIFRPLSTPSKNLFPILYFAKKFPAHSPRVILSPTVNGGTFVVRLERLLKILIPYGVLERTDKLLLLYTSAGWTAIKIFPQSRYMPNVTGRQAEGGHKSKRLTAEGRKIYRERICCKNDHLPIESVERTRRVRWTKKR